MSILIKGLQMPKKGMCIDIVVLDDGTVVYYDDDKKIGEAVELPDHGDLIDREALREDLGINDFDCEKCKWHGSFSCKGGLDFDEVCSSIEYAEAVIPAERSEEECEDENWYTERDDPKIAERSEDERNH